MEENTNHIPPNTQQQHSVLQPGAEVNEPKQPRRIWGILAAVFGTLEVSSLALSIILAPDDPSAHLHLTSLSLKLLIVGGGIIAIPSILFNLIYLVKSKPKGYKMAASILVLAISAPILLLASFALAIFLLVILNN